MSNNKQSMKLYTEEQVKKMIEKSRETGLTAEYLILTTTPIELPSDEEIKKQAEHEDTYSKKSLLQEAQNGCGTEHLDATMSNKKQSSIMSLYEKMFVNHGRITIEEFEQVKAMHKEEMVEFSQEVFRNRYNQVYQSLGNIADDIYNETFGDNNE